MPLCMSPYMHTLSETEFPPRKYSAESIGRVIVKDNDEVMIEYREREGERKGESELGKRSAKLFNVPVCFPVQCPCVACPAPEKRQRVPSAYNRFIK